MSWRVPIAVPLVLLSTLLAACSKPPAFTGVRVLGANGVESNGGDYGVDLHRMRPSGAVLDGPHYTLRIAWIGTGTSLSARDAQRLGTTPVRAADGGEIVVAGVDAEDTYAPFTGGHVEVSLTVAGQATPIPQLPLAAARNGIPGASTEVILVSAERGAALRLRATDAGRSEELDLRTGKVLANSYDRRQSGELAWSGKATVRANLRIGGVPATATTMSLDNAVSPLKAKQVATLTSYTPALGWAANGSAILLIPAPQLTVDGLLFYGRVREQFDDRNVFTVRTSDGKTVRAQPHQRELDMLGLASDDDETPVTFLVPAGTTSGTAVMNLARAQLVEVDDRPAKISWAKPPTPFNLAVSLTR